MSNPTESDTTHSLADLSATYRDLLWVLSQTGSSESGPLHHVLSDYYTDDIDQARICNILEELIERDFVTEQSYDTIEYRLTELGRRALSARQTWQSGIPTTEGGSQ